MNSMFINNAKNKLVMPHKSRIVVCLKRPIKQVI